MKRILLGMPVGSGQIPSEMVMCLHELQKNIPEGYELVMDFRNRELVQRARNSLIQRAYDEKFDYLFFLDDDNPVPAQTIKWFIQDNKHIVTGVIPGRFKTGKGKYCLCIMEEKQNEFGISYYDNMYTMPEGNELFEIDNMGTGCVMLNKLVIQYMYERYKGLPFLFKYDISEVDTKTKSVIGKLDIDEDFGDRDIHIGYYSEDLMFFHRAKTEGGFQLWCDPRVKGYHISDPLKIKVDDKFYDRDITTSVIIPVYNQLEYTKQILKDIQKKPTTKYEIIVVNDGSTDGTKEYLDNIKDYLDIKVIHHESNQGVNASRRDGFSKAEGKYCLVINNDIIMSEGLDQELVWSLEQSSAIVTGPITTNNKEMTIGSNYKNDNIIGRCRMIETEKLRTIPPIPSNLRNWFGDDWIFRRAKRLKAKNSVGVCMKAKVFHYESMTVGKDMPSNPDKRKLYESDIMERHKICDKEGREENRRRKKP